MFGPGLLGTRADLMMDIVMLSLIVVLPTMALSYARVRRKAYSAHKRLQVWLTIVLVIAVSLFELDLHASGGVKELAKGGTYYGTSVLATSLYVHLTFSVTTFFLWVGVFLGALASFAKPPRPHATSHWHRWLGRLTMIDMLLTALTGFEVYLVAFVL